MVAALVAVALIAPLALISPAGAQAQETIQLSLSAPDALKFDTAGATTPGSPSATLREGARFLSPRPFQIRGTVKYSPPAQNPPVPQLTLQNASVFLTLPPGLEFGTNPNTGQRDTGTKALGNLAPGAEVNATWYVQATGETFGTLTYSMTMTAQDFSARTTSRSILVPATPLRRVQAGAWQMIGFPFLFDPVLSNNGDPSTVINRITRPADDNAIFFHWIDPEQRYERVVRLETGRSYFYRPNITRTIFASGVYPVPDQGPVPTPPAQPTNLFQLPINPGWNQIANPYVYNIPLSNIRVVARENNPNLTSVSFADAVTSGLVQSSVFFLTEGGNSYDFLPGVDAPLQPWVGYWVFANSPVILLFVPPSQRDVGILPVPGQGYVPTRKAALGAIRSRAAFVAQPTMEEWKLQMVASMPDGREDGATLLGVSPAARDGADLRDLPKPPPPFSGYVYAGITRPEGGRRLAQDIKMPGGTKTWDVEVVADENGPVMLSWPNLATLPKRLSLTLTEVATGRKVSLRGASSYRFQAAKDAPHRFRITASTAARKPFAIVNMRSAPTRGGRHRFEFELTDDAVLSGQVRTLSGKKAADLATGRAAASGPYSLYWDGRSADGSHLPAGPYVVELTARNSDGQSATVKRVITLLR